jgi:hypothetical protein
MTIESVSHPAPLSSWDGENKDQPYYLELFGEARPAVDTAYAEAVPAGTAAETPATVASAPVYEYWWTIGHPGHREHRGGILERTHASKDLWERLADTAARVYLYFPLGGGWRVKELVATVKYMSPVAHQQSFWEKAAQDWQIIQPLVQDASTLASAVGPAGAVAGGVADQSAKMLGGLAQMKLDSVPQVKGFEWSAAKVTFGNKEHGGVMQGVAWTLPKSMFAELGGRLTGGLAVSFLPDLQQDPDAGEVATAAPPPQAQHLLAHAVVYGPDEEQHWAPDQRSFIKLLVHPQVTQNST